VRPHCSISVVLLPPRPARLVISGALCANIDETLSAALIREQGGKENDDDRRLKGCSHSLRFTGAEAHPFSAENEKLRRRISACKRICVKAEIIIELAGEPVKLQVFSMRSMFSGAAFHRAYFRVTKQKDKGPSPMGAPPPVPRDLTLTGRHLHQGAVVSNRPSDART